MTAPYYSLIDKASNALALYLRSELPEQSRIIYPAKRALEKEAPCIICAAETGTPELAYSGRYVIDCTISVCTLAVSSAPESQDGSDEAVAASSELVATVFDAFHFGDHGEGLTLANALTEQVEDFTCHIVRHESISQEFDDNVWRDIMRIKIVCSPVDIA